MDPSQESDHTKHSTSGQVRGFFSDWLEKLQQESWQLELLISGLALFLVWESREQLDGFRVFVQSHSGFNSPANTVLQILPSILSGIWTIFMINLLVHVFARGLWIGAIGLRYVSGDIDYEELGYNKTFDSFLRKKVGNFDEFIERLERFCSVLFAYTFLLVFVFVSGALLLLFFMMLQSVGNNMSRGLVSGEVGVLLPLVWGFVLILIFGLIVLFLIDALTFGGLKRTAESGFNRVFYRLYRFFGFISLAFLYRPLYYNFIDHKYSKRLLLFSIPYFALVFMVFPNLGFTSSEYFPLLDAEDAVYAHYNDVNSDFPNFDELTIRWAAYEDLRQTYLGNHPEAGPELRSIRSATLDHYAYTDEPFAKVFLRIRPSDDSYFEQVHQLEPFYDLGLVHDWFRSIESDSLDSMREAFRVLSDSLTRGLSSRNPEERRQIDSIYALIDVQKTARIQDYKLGYTNRIMAAAEDMFRLEVDGEQMDELCVCRFFLHPNQGERGLLCHLPIDSLASGSHILKIGKSRFAGWTSETKEPIRRERVISIPFFVE